MAAEAPSVLAQSFDIRQDNDSGRQFAVRCGRGPCWAYHIADWSRPCKSYAFQVSRGDASWMVYRRYRQFVDLDAEVRACAVPRA